MAPMLAHTPHDSSYLLTQQVQPESQRCRRRRRSTRGAQQVFGDAMAAQRSALVLASYPVLLLLVILAAFVRYLWVALAMYCALLFVLSCASGTFAARAASDEEEARLSRGGLSPTVITPVAPAFPYEPPAAGAPVSDCAVCLEAMKAGEAARRLPACAHAFHRRREAKNRPRGPCSSRRPSRRRCSSGRGVRVRRATPAVYRVVSTSRIGLHMLFWVLIKYSCSSVLFCWLYIYVAYFVNDNAIIMLAILQTLPGRHRLFHTVNCDLKRTREHY
ncbi:hypothetical protein SEVIR_4G139801v4 [Setaria viridis]|uniref:uncharacterized protein n=1 Tax=Setaria viridis TaxID=4556 RepID=UPI0014938D45|nr:uncharacterized protein LOC117853979 [Setaria viridis]